MMESVIKEILKYKLKMALRIFPSILLATIVISIAFSCTKYEQKYLYVVNDDCYAESVNPDIAKYHLKRLNVLPRSLYSPNGFKFTDVVGNEYFLSAYDYHLLTAEEIDSASNYNTDFKWIRHSLETTTPIEVRHRDGTVAPISQQEKQNLRIIRNWGRPPGLWYFIPTLVIAIFLGIRGALQNADMPFSDWWIIGATLLLIPLFLFFANIVLYTPFWKWYVICFLTAMIAIYLLCSQISKATLTKYRLEAKQKYEYGAVFTGIALCFFSPVPVFLIFKTFLNRYFSDDYISMQITITIVVCILSFALSYILWFRSEFLKQNEKARKIIPFIAVMKGTLYAVFIAFIVLLILIYISRLLLNWAYKLWLRELSTTTVYLKDEGNGTYRDETGIRYRDKGDGTVEKF